jgi:replicative DNA helicase
MQNIPHNSDLEESLLGSIMTEPAALNLILPILKTHHFYEDKHSIIYQAIQNLCKVGITADMLTVVTEVKKMGRLEYIGGPYFISSLVTRVVSTANVEVHARHIQESYFKRQAYKIANEVISKVLEPTSDCFDLLNQFQTSIQGITEGLTNKSFRTIGEYKNVVLDNCYDVLQGKISASVPVRIDGLQLLTNGWKKGNLIILAARPGMGKTAVALDYAEYPASLGIPTAIFSLEMTGAELAGRVMSQRSGVDGMRINNHTVNRDEYKFLVNQTDLDTIPLYIDETPGQNILQLRAKAMQLKREKNIQLIVVDYLQLMDGIDSRDNREQEVSKISRGLKKLAKELEIPIIALAQLNRELERRPDKKPQLSDLRDSGAIEQDADMVIFLLRPEYYGIENYNLAGENLSTRGLLVKIIAKNRGGITGEIKCRWNGSSTSITNY